MTVTTSGAADPSQPCGFPARRSRARVHALHSHAISLLIAHSTRSRCPLVTDNILHWSSSSSPHSSSPSWRQGSAARRRPPGELKRYVDPTLCNRCSSHLHRTYARLLCSSPRPPLIALPSPTPVRPLSPLFPSPTIAAVPSPHLARPHQQEARADGRRHRGHRQGRGLRGDEGAAADGVVRVRAEDLHRRRLQAGRAEQGGRRAGAARGGEGPSVRVLPAEGGRQGGEGAG